MSSITLLVVLILLAAVFIYTLSYGNFVWKQNNKPGAIAVFFLALVSLTLPLLIIFMRM